MKKNTVTKIYTLRITGKEFTQLFAILARAKTPEAKRLVAKLLYRIVAGDK